MIGYWPTAAVFTSPARALRRLLQPPSNCRHAGRNGRPRRVQLVLRYGPVQLWRPLRTMERGLPAQVRLNLIEVVEPHPPKGTEPVYWRLLTTHHIADPFAA